MGRQGFGRQEVEVVRVAEGVVAGSLTRNLDLSIQWLWQGWIDCGREKLHEWFRLHRLRPPPRFLFPDRSGLSAQLHCEIAVEVGNAGMAQDRFQPGVSLESNDCEIPHTGR